MKRFSRPNKANRPARPQRPANRTANRTPARPFRGKTGGQTEHKSYKPWQDDDDDDQGIPRNLQRGEEWMAEEDWSRWDNDQTDRQSKKEKRHDRIDGRQRYDNTLEEGPRNLDHEMTDVIIAVIHQKKRLDKCIEETLRRRDDWRAGLRKQFVEELHAIIRQWRWLWFVAGRGDAYAFTSPDQLSIDQVLRAYRSGRKALGEASPAIACSVPDWLWERGVREMGRARWANVLAKLDAEPSLYLRVNTHKTTTQKVLLALQRAEVEARPVPKLPNTIEVTNRKLLFATDAFKNGHFVVQDVNSQFIAPFCDVTPGMKVADVCAGAGGKTLHLSCIMQNKGEITAMDTTGWKLNELQQRAKRANAFNYRTQLIQGDGPWKRLAGKFDRVLVDVPCSGLGVMRRHPDARWLLTEAEVDHLVKLQAEILAIGATITKPDGKLIYSTCSVLPSENEGQIAAFLKKNKAWSIEQEARALPGEQGGDGFYAARLIRE